jgi:Holliday junction resolvasome RuvABC ATP-dependent DNA helicase subunit
MSAPAVSAALDRLVQVGRAGGLDARTARDEGAAVAATVAQSTPDAPGPWAQAVGVPAATTTQFFEQAMRARRWRATPTDGLVALLGTDPTHAHRYATAMIEVAWAAAMLGSGGTAAARAAQAVAVAQLQAVGAQIAPVTSAAEPAGPPFPSLTRAGDALLAPLAPVPDVPLTPPSAPTLPADTAPTATPDDPPALTVEDLLDELDALVGLDDVKDEVHRQVALLRVAQLREAAGMKPPTVSRHMVFVGNPGTGKTTVARLVCRIYAAMGLLAGGHLVETDRSDLVAGYMGQTAIKTTEVLDRALGGLLLIDEAYALAGDAYGAEAVATLVKAMEDHRDDLVVVVAGYPAPMAEFLATTNPGLRDRFRLTLAFEDYDDDQLTAILESMATAADYTLTDSFREGFNRELARVDRADGFSNARWVRNVFESAVAAHAWRLADVPDPTADQLRELVGQDLLDPDDHAPVEPPTPVGGGAP